MRLISTRGTGEPVDLRTALFQGLAPDGGLYLPEAVDPLPADDLAALRGRSLQEIGIRVAAHLLRDEFPDEELQELVTRALSFPVPLVSLDSSTRVLELFHGPTGSFKDVGARFLAVLVGAYRAVLDRPVVVVVATSGDTGGAVAHAFHRESGVRTVVLFPEGKVSPVQRRQLTEVGGNVEPVAVLGTFDDCQHLVKRAIADPALAEEALLTSANSINVGRLVPQSFYYVHAWSRLQEDAPPPLFSVPSGNLGNLTAGVLAHRMGVPVSGFVAATNVNDTMVRFLETGRLEPGRAVQTLSSAMDVAEPNNLERLLHLFGGDPATLAECVTGSCHTDDETLEAIRRVHEEHGYLMDPHTAVGWLALQKTRSMAPDAPGVVLATASPAKFPETVRRATGIEPDWRSMIPEGGSEEGAADVAEIEPVYEELIPLLRP